MLGLAVVSPAAADEALAKGKLLVATDEVRGSNFAETVILLLHYDEFGAQGLVVNRRLGTAPAELLPDDDTLRGYSGTVFWGGPVQLSTLRVLVRTDNPSDDAVSIFGNVYQVPVDEGVAAFPLDDANVRFFVGYAGWSPGQLDRELRFGSWQVLPASESSVFATDPGAVWKSLRPVEQLRADTRLSRSPCDHQSVC